MFPETETKKNDELDETCSARERKVLTKENRTKKVEILSKPWFNLLPLYNLFPRIQFPFSFDSNPHVHGSGSHLESDTDDCRFQ